MSVLSTPYPHLIPEDSEVWSRFLDQWGKFYSRFDYDVRVGAGRDPGDSFPGNIRDMGILLSQRRIDAIGYTPKNIQLFEITRVADLKTIGQLIAYPTLYRETYNPTKPLQTSVVAVEIGTDLAPAYRKLNISVYLV